MGTLSLGTAPAEEACAQVGSEGYLEQARREARLYRAQLKRIVAAANKTMPKNCTFVIKYLAGEGGQEVDLVLEYNQIPDCIEFVHWLESELPSHWDEHTPLGC